MTPERIDNSVLVMIVVDHGKAFAYAIKTPTTFKIIHSICLPDDDNDTTSLVETLANRFHIPFEVVDFDLNSLADEYRDDWNWTHVELFLASHLHATSSEPNTENLAVKPIIAQNSLNPSCNLECGAFGTYCKCNDNKAQELSS